MMTMQTGCRGRLAALVFTGVLALGAGTADAGPVARAYADIAAAGYADSLAAARALRDATDALVARPSEAALRAAREAWRAARVPYQQTEVFRFGNAIVDDWEGKVNAWPLDEGLIDYVAGGGDAPNVIANPVLRVAGAEVDARRITPALLENELHEAGGIEANVATGYHAIEFLLWGQDLNGTGPGAGMRPASDFDPADCSGGACERRAGYLRAAADLLVSDLEWMAAAWAAGGEARREVESASAEEVLRTILAGLGGLAYGELAGERMKLGLMLHDPEEEHDCFSDNTHESHYWNAVGLRNVYTGRYVRTGGGAAGGASLSGLVAARDPALDAEVRARLEAAVAALDAIRASARSGAAYDQLLAEGNAEGERLIMTAVDALVSLADSFGKAGDALGVAELAFEGSDSLDDPEAVFQ